VQRRVPIWLGGRSARSLRRALLFGDGWDPFRLTLEELAELLRSARDSAAWREPFDVVLTPPRPPDPTEAAARGRLRDLVAAYEDAGATVLNLRFAHRSVEHCVEQLQAFMELAA
jgi:alkanesulfonate monooxygenase SsuD/methylene tetrahydromethanopterin reductase-like flavin-dependent oxidoreductase (luciferase family)